MKKHIHKIIHRPLYTAIASLIVAGALGAAGYSYINNSQEQKFDTSAIGSGTLSDVVTVNSTSTTEHLTLGFVTGGKIQSVPVKAGDSVTKGEVLASLDTESTVGALTQAKAAYASAQANYDKVVNGASDSTVNVAKSSIDTANQNLLNLIQNSYTQADSVIRTDVDNLYINKTAYSADFEITFFDNTSNTTVTLTVSDPSVRQDLGDSWIQTHGLLNSWQSASKTTSDADVNLTLKNLNSIKSYLLKVSSAVNSINYDSKYQANMDKYKGNIAAARGTIDTAIANIQNAQQALAAAKTNVAAVTSSARPEDVAAAKAQVENAYGALQIAQSSYDNRLITAPMDGTITAVHITPGEIAVANTAAIEMESKR